MSGAAVRMAIVLAMLSTPVGAQAIGERLFNTVAECGRATCQRAVTRAILQLRRQELPREDFNSNLGMMAGAMFSTVRETQDPRQARRMSVAMLRLARFSSDPLQRRALLKVARALRRGDQDLFDLEDPFAVSPS